MTIERCLLCHWEPNKPKEGDHLPDIGALDDASGVYVCGGCVARAKTVEQFGLTVDELRLAAKAYKEAWEQKWTKKES
jgi:hypothetical protein